MLSKIRGIVTRRTGRTGIGLRNRCQNRTRIAEKPGPGRALVILLPAGTGTGPHEEFVADVLGVMQTKAPNTPNSAGFVVRRDWMPACR